MNEYILVCPFDENLIRRLSGKALVVRTTDYELIPHIDRFVNEHNKLHCVWVIDKERILTSIPFAEKWINIPIQLYLSSGSGAFRDMLSKLQLLRQLSTRVFFPAEKQKNLTDVMILASLGVDCGIYWDEEDNEKIDWEALNDLLHYAIYTRTKHAAIEPFHYVASNYNPGKPTDFGSVYFDNPHRYLHVDHEENIALSHKDLIKKKFITKGIGGIDNITENQMYMDSQTQWQEFFLKNTVCASCPAWRVCLGKFSSTSNQNPSCKKFFSDLMDASDFYRDLKKKEDKKLCRL